MKLVTIKQEYYDIFDFETELERRVGQDGKERPFLVILELKYKGKKISFALPFRSNIQVNSSTKGTYFSLPRRNTTKDGHAHGLHYIKIFPVNKQYLDKYVIPQTKYNKMLYNYVKKNLPEIVKQSQNYLIEYEKGKRERYCTDIDRLLNAMNDYELAKEELSKPKDEVALAK